MIPPEARDIFLYYGGAIVLGLLIFMMSNRRHKGMRLRLKGRTSSRVGASPEGDNIVHINGAKPRDFASMPPNAPAGQFSHIQPRGERPLNVVFNYNGHSWDAYEVLGLPAGSSPENVERAYRDGIRTVDAGSKAFLEAAYHAIVTEWKSYKASGG